MRNRSGRVIAVVAMLGSFLLGGLTYGAVQWAGADGAGVTYYGCLSVKGALSKVGTVSTTLCPKSDQQISWNSVGPQGPPGPAGTSAFGTAPPFAPVSSTGAQCTIGQIILTAGPFAQGVIANGQYLSRTIDPVLFQVIGTQFGDDPNGNGVLFRVPDLQAAAPNGLTYSICDRGVFPTP